MNDRQTLDMPSRRFWAMEAQIDRIRSESDLRLINIQVSAGSSKGAEQAVERLCLELGDKYQIERPTIVKPDADAGEKLRKFMGG